jgi:hypothetical protein
MKRIALALALVAASLSGQAHAETLDNARIVELIKAGLGDEVIVAKIKSTVGTYDTSTDALIALKGAGVSGPVLAAMIDASSGTRVTSNMMVSSDSPDPTVPHRSGIYMLAGWLPDPKMQVINPTTSNQTRTGGMLGFALTGGIASMSIKTVIPGKQARIIAQVPRPTFYFYFDQANRSLSDGATSTLWAAGSVTSPSEFSLVRFDVKKDRREAKVGKINVAGGQSGVMDKDRVLFDYNEISPGVFAVTPAADLPVGEYGFIYSVSAGSGPGLSGVGAQTTRVFDFSIPEGVGISEKKK